MTKTEKIRAVAKKHPQWSTSRIGKACDCRPEYVRVVLRQRVNGAESEIDKRYRAANREAIIARNRQWQRDNPERHREYVRRYYWRKKAEREAAHA